MIAVIILLALFKTLSSSFYDYRLISFTIRLTIIMYWNNYLFFVREQNNYFARTILKIVNGEKVSKTPLYLNDTGIKNVSGKILLMTVHRV